MRMSERTQLQFVWFAGYFLKSLFDDMFENVRIEEDSIRRVSIFTSYTRNNHLCILDSSCNSGKTCRLCSCDEERH